MTEATSRRNFTNDVLLRQAQERDGFSFDSDILPPILTRETFLVFACACGTSNRKTYRGIVDKKGLCKVCMEVLRRTQTQETNLERYGVVCPLRNEEIKAQIVQTFMQRYGVSNPMQNEEVRARAVETNLERYGTPCSLQNPEVQAKSKATLMDQYGVENAMQNKEVQAKSQATCMANFGVPYSTQSQVVKDKTIQTNIKRYGVENPMHNTQVKEKLMETNMARFGVPHAMQNAEVAERASKSVYGYKDYVFPSGKVIRIQGYENYALDKLIHDFDEDDLITSKCDVPEIWWTDPSGIRRRYYVDIFIPSINHMIEVKSTWTFEKDKHENFTKQKACQERGYHHEIWVIDTTGDILEII
jgi:hypothetical protein